MFDIDENVLSDLKKGFNLPPKPELLTQLQQAISEQEPNLNHIADIANGDVAIAAAVIKVINSPFYGLARTVTDIKQAVMFLGLDSINHLVTGFLIKQAFNQTKCCISLERFWDSASEVAHIATVIGNKIKSRVPIENLHLVGLFHDAGIPAMAIKYPDYIHILAASNRDYHTSLIEREENTYQTNHAVIGYYLATSWNLPTDICQIILRHHDHSYLTGNCQSINELTFATLKMAENLVHIQKRFVASPDWPFVKEAVLKTLELDESDYLDIKEDTEEFLN